MGLNTLWRAGGRGYGSRATPFQFIKRGKTRELLECEASSGRLQVLSLVYVPMAVRVAILRERSCPYWPTWPSA
ncbi:TPA: hypothetical protein EYP44_04590, partial [Candidatus Bathyarchaeota archaeon]|nr:hypothetical protein [Candidatus Bathyarchaeota archaeon]